MLLFLLQISLSNMTVTLMEKLNFGGECQLRRITYLKDPNCASKAVPFLLEILMRKEFQEETEL